MKSKQISFLALNDDLNAFEKFLVQSNFSIIANPMPDNKPYIVDNLNFSEVKFSFIKYLCLNNQLNLVQSNYVETFHYYMTDVVISPVVEIILPKINFATKEYKEGRLYYTAGYYDSSGAWNEKNIEFLNSAKKLFDWIRKNFSKSNSGEFDGIYLSDGFLRDE